MWCLQCDLNCDAQALSGRRSESRRPPSSCLQSGSRRRPRAGTGNSHPSWGRQQQPSPIPLTASQVLLQNLRPRRPKPLLQVEGGSTAKAALAKQTSTIKLPPAGLQTGTAVSQKQPIASPGALAVAAAATAATQSYKSNLQQACRGD